MTITRLKFDVSSTKRPYQNGIVEEAASFACSTSTTPLRQESGRPTHRPETLVETSQDTGTLTSTEKE